MLASASYGQYLSNDYSQAVDDHGVLASIGTVGDAYDNALAESFVDSFKTELIRDRVWRTRSQLELAIVEYVAWFNTERLHTSLGACCAGDGPGYEPSATSRSWPRTNPSTLLEGHAIAETGRPPRSIVCPAAAA